MRVEQVWLAVLGMVLAGGEAVAQAAPGAAAIELALQTQPNQWDRVSGAASGIRHVKTGLICVPGLGQMQLTEATSDSFTSRCNYSTEGTAVGLSLGAEFKESRETVYDRALRVAQ